MFAFRKKLKYDTITMGDKVIFVDNETDYNRFLAENKDISWLTFDTEFVGEKRYHTLLCLIQVGTDNGFYLLDPLRLSDLSDFYSLLANPNILKITHAGENDYRLLYRASGLLPQNVFDTQVAAAFVGYNYPTSFGRLLDGELHIALNKGYTVSDWESRPINKKQIQYALDDVLHLKKLYDKLHQKLVKLHRLEWAEEEFSKMEKAAHYEIDPYREAFTHNLIHKLNTQEQIFLIRLVEWRRQQAERRNHSKEMVLPAKYLTPIVKNIRSGKAALKNHRRLPDHVVRKHWDRFNELHQQKITLEEKEILKKIPKPLPESAGQEASMELLSLLLKMKAKKEGLALGMLNLGIDMKRMKADNRYFDEQLDIGWRKHFIGEAMIHWLRNRDRLEVDFSREECVLRLR